LLQIAIKVVFLKPGLPHLEVKVIVTNCN
jgi:hypothetical protein